jgi:hypothetical protein
VHWLIFPAPTLHCAHTAPTLHRRWACGSLLSCSTLAFILLLLLLLLFAAAAGSEAAG